MEFPQARGSSPPNPRSSRHPAKLIKTKLRRSEIVQEIELNGRIPKGYGKTDVIVNVNPVSFPRALHFWIK